MWLKNAIRNLRHKQQADELLDEEVHGYAELLAEEKIRGGMSIAEARREAKMELGGIEQVKEQTREVRAGHFLETLWQDLRYGARMLRKNPGFTVVAVLTLALGIGANTAIFSMIDAILLSRLPYPNASRLVMVWEDVHLPHYQNNEDTPAPGNYVDWKEQNSVFSSMAAIRYRSWNLTGSGEPVRIEGEAFSADIFSVLQTYPVIGRIFTADEDRQGASHVALLGYGLWTSRFGGDRTIVGRTIQLDGEDYRVIGVMPREFRFPDPTDQLYVPLGLSAEELANHHSHYLRVVARLKPGVTVAKAHSDLQIVAKRLTAQYPDSNTGVGVSVVPLREMVAGDLRLPLFVLFGVVALLLLMVCANVASLLFARASVRAREIAMRAALGASRARLVLQLLVESVLLASLGGILGLAFAFWGIYVLRSYAPVTLDLPEVHLDALVCVFTLSVSLFAGIIFGLAPAFQSSRLELSSVLQEGARESVPRAHRRAHASLIVTEIALGVVVLIGTGLLLHSFVQLEEIPLGFQAQNVLTFRAILRGPAYSSLAQQTAFYRQMIEHIGSLPGVGGVGGISFLPLTLQGRTTVVSIEGRAPVASGQLPFIDYRSVSPGYFLTMQIPIRRGRNFSWSDDSKAPLAAVVSASMARIWPNGDAIGKRFKLGAPDAKLPWITVVGVVTNVRQLGLVGEPRPAMYFAATQDSGTGDTLRDWVVRAPDSVVLMPAIRSAISSIDPSLPVSRVQTMEQIRSTYLGPQRFELSLAGLFGLAALILAAVGLYGVTSYTVARRTHEIGIRMALGAQRRDVVRLIVGQGARLALIGVAIGIGVALVLTPLLSSLLYGVSATDPLTFAGVAIVLTIVALAACYIPARRAMRVDPMVALRYE
ncbi:MAG TPA: ABC transporter permease [Candidatus Acidoferrales bacterium]|nr:ABC transporter permease [Candidatus Acidoferrales bacterium]